MTKRAETGELERARGEWVVEEVADESYSLVGLRPLAFSSGTVGGCGEEGSSGEGSGQVSLERDLAETSRDLEGLRDM